MRRLRFDFTRSLGARSFLAPTQRTKKEQYIANYFLRERLDSERLVDDFPASEKRVGFKIPAILFEVYKWMLDQPDIANARKAENVVLDLSREFGALCENPHRNFPYNNGIGMASVSLAKIARSHPVDPEKLKEIAFYVINFAAFMHFRYEYANASSQSILKPNQQEIINMFYVVGLFFRFDGNPKFQEIGKYLLNAILEDFSIKQFSEKDVQQIAQAAALLNLKVSDEVLQRLQEYQPTPSKIQNHFFNLLKAYYPSACMEELLFDAYFVDVYIPELNVVIEVDGPLHRKVAQQGVDKMRDAFLEDKGVIVIRIPVMSNVDDMVNTALHQLQHLDPNSSVLKR